MLRRSIAPAICAALTLATCSNDRFPSPPVHVEQALGSATQLKDINPVLTDNSTSPVQIVNVGGVAVYAANDPYHGTELWKSDGTAQGTKLIADVWPGPTSSNIAQLVSAGSYALFQANDGTHGSELWRTDGTAAGTVLLADVNPGPNSGSPTSFVVVGSTVFFAATDQMHGTELWKTDGTAQGTGLAVDLIPGPGSAAVSGLCNVNGTLFFSASDSTHGSELWKSDGTAAGTSMVLDINPAMFTSSSPTFLVNVGGTLFFQANDGMHGAELWKSQGTAMSTTMVLDINPVGATGSQPVLLTNANGRLFFAANDGSHGVEPWTSDGTTTAMVMDVNAVGVTSSNPNSFVALGPSLFFVANNGSGVQLWQTDGTTTAAVTGVGTPTANTLLALGSALYLQGNDVTHGPELWRTDGMTSALVLDIFVGGGGSSPSQLAAVGSTLFFQANDGVHGTELWKSDGTAQGTAMVFDGAFSADSLTPTSPLGFTTAGSQVFFAAFDPAHGTELWKTDGTVNGTALVADLWPGGGSSTPVWLTAFDGGLLYSANDSVRGIELWRTDGTPLGTSNVADIAPAGGSSSPAFVVVAGGLAFFTANDGAHGVEVWRTDGTSNPSPAGTYQLADIFPGATSSNPAALTAVGSSVFFTANDNVHGQELWKSDGTTAGTALVADVLPGAGSSGIGALVNANGTLFFTASDGVHGVELWKSDGTTNGTVLVADLVFGSGSSSPQFLTAAGSAVLFTVNDSLQGPQLWKSDGTAAGTVLVSPFSRDLLSQVRASIAVGSLAYFDVFDQVHGFELWRTDGTGVGTFLLSDLAPGPTSGVPQELSVTTPPNVTLAGISGTLVFAGYTPAGGFEVWRSDGTADSTVQVTDLAAGSDSSNPSGFAVAGTTLVFSAQDGTTGYEPYGVPLGAVVDSAPPMVTCPGDKSASATSSAGAAVSYSAATATDDFSSSPRLSYSQASGTTFPIGTTRVTATAADAAGHQAQCSFNVVVSLPAPTLGTPLDGFTVTMTSVSVSGTGLPGAVVEVLDGAAIVGAFNVDGSGNWSGSVTLANGMHTLTAKQLAGGQVSAASSPAIHGTVTGVGMPMLSGVPMDKMVEATTAAGAMVGWPSPIATDPIDGLLAVTCAPASGSVFPLGTTMVLCSAKNSRNTTVQQGFYVTVSDNTAPRVVCPADVTAEATGPNGAAVTFSAVAIDAVTAAPTVTAAPASGTTFALGPTTVTVTAKDAVNNMSACSFKVTVVDTTAPALACPSVSAVSADGQPVMVSFAPGATDAVTASPTVTADPVSGSAFPVGMTTVSVTATDQAGNASHCTFTVDVSRGSSGAGGGTGAGGGAAAGGGGEMKAGGCGCASGGAAPALLMSLALVRRRRRQPAAGLTGR